MNLKFGDWWHKLSADFLAQTGSLGVYLARDGLTLAQVQKTLSGLQVQHLVRLPWDPDNLEELAARLAEIVASWDLQSYPVSLAVSQDLGFFRPATLPRAAAENLSQVVAYELDRFLPLPADSLYFDFQVLEEKEDGIHLALMALPREPVSRCLTLLEQVGLKPMSLELAPAAMANAFALLAGRLPNSWVLLDAKKEGFELFHIQSRTLHSVRHFGGARPENLAAILADELDRLKEADNAPKALACCGQPGKLDLAGLCEPRDLMLITPTQFAIKGLPRQAEMAALLPALGAALRGVGNVPLAANLLPLSQRAAVKLGGFSYLKVSLAVFLGLLCLWLGSLFIHKRVLLYQVNSQLAAIAPEAKQVEGQLAEVQALVKQLQNFRKLEQSPNKLRVLKHLTTLIPENTWLFNLRISQLTLEISGMSSSAADLIPILDKSGWLTKTEFASPIVTDANKQEHFKIKAEIKGLELSS